MVISQEWSPKFKMLFSKILGLALFELALQSSLKKHVREKVKKVDPHYFSILEGVYFLHFCPKIALSASNCIFYQKCQFLALLWVLEGKLQFEALTAIFGQK